jgi:hypothetical protein
LILEPDAALGSGMRLPGVAGGATREATPRGRMREGEGQGMVCYGSQWAMVAETNDQRYRVIAPGDETVEHLEQMPVD